MSVKDLKEKVADKAQQTQIQTQKPEANIALLLKKMEGEIQRALPKHMTAEKLARIALTTIRLNPTLLKCNQASLLGAIMQAAQLGLEPGLLGQCYLIPYNNRKLNTMEAQFQIGYKGYIELVRRTGQVSVIEAHEVCENDFFEFEYGLNSKLVHKPCIKGERGIAYCYYAFAKMKDDSYAFMVMSKEDINKIRDKYSKTKDNGPWVSEYDAMAKKTVLKQLIKYLPLSTEVMTQLAQDETTKTEIKEDMTEALDIEYMSAEHVEADYTEVAADESAEAK
jgi:recombination protein RecT